MTTMTMSTALAVCGTDEISTNEDGTTHSPGSPEFALTATHMAREFSEATTEIARLLGALRVQTDRLNAAFTTDAYSRFSVDLQYQGRRHDLDDKGAAELVEAMGRSAWYVLLDALGIKNVMSVAKRKMIDEQLQRGALPPICEATILSILLGFTEQVDDFAREAAREVFDILRPQGRYQGGKYATNNAFRVGRKVILPYRIELNYGGDGYRVDYHREQELTAIDGVFHLLGGHGVMRENKGPLIAAINATDKTGRGETSLFRFKCYRNRNLHLEFKDLDLVRQLNLLAVGERVLGDDVDLAHTASTEPTQPHH